MAVPVIIPAYNEERFIGRALDSLSTGLVEPVVVANGCSDATAVIARGFGAQVIETEEQGKMPAIQRGFRFLGSRALGPVLCMDADAMPLYPHFWPRAMTRERYNNATPEVTVGPLLYCDVGSAESTVRSTRLYGVQVANRLRVGERRPVGANMMVCAKTDDALGVIMEMPHYWPGEDHAIVTMIIEIGGRYTPSLNPGSAVRVSGRYLSPIIEKLKNPCRHERVAASLDEYIQRGAPGSIPYGK